MVGPDLVPCSGSAFYSPRSIWLQALTQFSTERGNMVSPCNENFSWQCHEWMCPIRQFASWVIITQLWFVLFVPTVSSSAFNTQQLQGSWRWNAEAWDAQGLADSEQSLIGSIGTGLGDSRRDSLTVHWLFIVCSPTHCCNFYHCCQGMARSQMPAVARLPDAERMGVKATPRPARHCSTMKKGIRHSANISIA